MLERLEDPRLLWYPFCMNKEEIPSENVFGADNQQERIVKNAREILGSVYNPSEVEDVLLKVPQEALKELDELLTRRSMNPVARRSGLIEWATKWEQENPF